MGSAAEDNLTAVLHAKGDLRLEQRPIPVPKDDEVLIRMAKVGICGSDVHYWTHGRIGHFVVTGPMVIGHESAGVVVRCGKDVTSLKPGDRVAIEPGVPCRKCDDCKRGEYNLCADVVFCATPPDNGNLTRFYTHAADFCHKLPDHVSLEEGALLEPLCVGVQACKRAGVTLGSKVLITGAGPIGLVSMLVAKSMGATSIIMTDMVENRLTVAKNLGATHTIQVNASASAEDLAVEVEKSLGAKPDIAIDACGAESTIALNMLAVRSGGKICIIGHGPAEVKVPIIKAAVREVDIRGVFRYANCYPMALAMVASGTVDVKKLITHNFNMEKTLEAFEVAKTGAGGAIKVMIHVD